MFWLKYDFASRVKTLKLLDFPALPAPGIWKEMLHFLSGLSAGFLLMRNRNKGVLRIKLKFALAAEQNLPGEQPRR